MEVLTAIGPLVGVVIGGLLTICGSILTQCLKDRAIAKKDKPRKRLLEQMLKDERFPEHWRTLDTLMHVIGATEETTKRLLIEIGARASEDGQRLWGLVEYHPFEKTSK